LPSGTHYVRAVRVGEPPVAAPIRYRLAREDALRALAQPEVAHAASTGRTASVRGHRARQAALFWPLGIRDARAMRQGAGTRPRSWAAGTSDEHFSSIATSAPVPQLIPARRAAADPGRT